MLLSAVCVRVCVYRCSIKYKKGWHKIGLVAVKIKHPMDLRLHWSYLVADKHKRMFSTLNPRAYASLASHLKKSIRCEFFCTDFFDIHCNMMSAKGLNFSMAILNLSTHIQCTQHNTNTFNCMLKHTRIQTHTLTHTPMDEEKMDKRRLNNKDGNHHLFSWSKREKRRNKWVWKRSQWRWRVRAQREKAIFWVVCNVYSRCCTVYSVHIDWSESPNTENVYQMTTNWMKGKERQKIGNHANVTFR